MSDPKMSILKLLETTLAPLPAGIVNKTIGVVLIVLASVADKPYFKV